MELAVKYSLEKEIERANYLLKDLERFGNLAVTLPKDDWTKKFNPADYEKHAIFLRENWSKVSETIKSGLSKCNLPVLDTYNVRLSKYGPGGSYDLPHQTVIVNITLRYEIGLLRTVEHEMIHLAIEPLVLEYQINRETKEHLVDLLFAKIDPELYKERTFPIDTSKIDKIFNEHYPDVKTIFQKLKEEKI